MKSLKKKKEIHKCLKRSEGWWRSTLITISIQIRFHTLDGIYRKKRKLFGSYRKSKTIWKLDKRNNLEFIENRRLFESYRKPKDLFGSH